MFDGPIHYISLDGPGRILAVAHGCDVTLLNQKTLCMFHRVLGVCADLGSWYSALGEPPNIARPSGIHLGPSSPRSANLALYK